MYFVERRPAVAPRLLRWYGLGAAPEVAPAVPVGVLVATVSQRLTKLRGYDLFLRDRTVMEWIKDNSALVNPVLPLLRSAKSTAIHEESHAFWTRLSDGERKAYVAEWIKLVDDGARLQAQTTSGGDARAAAPPAIVEAVKAWAVRADSFISRFEQTRQAKRIEARSESHSFDPFGSVKTAAIILGVGIVGAVAVGAFLLSRPPVVVTGGPSRR